MDVCLSACINTFYHDIYLCKLLHFIILPKLQCLCDIAIGCDLYNTVRGKYLKGENIGEFDKFVSICQVLPSKCPSFTIQIACKSKFASILPSKS